MGRLTIKAYFISFMPDKDMRPFKDGVSKVLHVDGIMLSADPRKYPPAE